MSDLIPRPWRSRLADPEASAGLSRFLLTTDGDGLPRFESNPSIRIDEDGRIELRLIDEYSDTHRNLVRAIWFKRRVVVQLEEAQQALRIVGRPYKALVCGPRFEEHYRQLSTRADFAGLSAVWLIDVDSVEEVGAADSRRLPLIHLDRIALRAPPGPDASFGARDGDRTRAG